MKRDYRIRAVCYGTDGRHTTRKMIPCLRELEALLRALPGVEVAAYTMDELMKTMYWTAHGRVAMGPHCGHYSWKPYIIMRELMNVDDGDVVWYMDADRRWRKGVDVLTQFVDLAKERGIVLVCYGDDNATWTQRATFVHMGMDEEKYWRAPHLNAGIQVFERSNLTLRFVQDWLMASLSYDVIANRKSKYKEFEEFREHRHDQSILSILAAHYDIEPHKTGDVFFGKVCAADPPGYGQEKPWTHKTGRR